MSARAKARPQVPAMAECCPPLVDAPLSEVGAAELARGFAALAAPARLRLLSLVAQAGEVCACDLIEPLGKSQPTVSHHLKVLTEAGLLTHDKRGVWAWYSQAADRLSALAGARVPPPAGGRADRR